jgi:hypothetical protein
MTHLSYSVKQFTRFAFPSELSLQQAFPAFLCCLLESAVSELTNFALHYELSLINITITILDIFHRPVFYLKLNLTL